MGTYGIDTLAEAEAVLARLALLPESVFEGVPQGFDMNRDAWGEKPGYRDVSFGSILPTGRTARSLGLGEEDQPHAWTFEVRHTAATRADVRRMSRDTDLHLVGWTPTANTTPVKPYYFVQYDSRNQSGAILSYTAIRFYETILGVLSP